MGRKQLLSASIQEQLADLIAVNDFWADYAQHQGKTPFLSVKLPAASRNFSEMMLALAVLDLPFEPAEHKSSGKDQRYEVIPGSDMLVFHKEIRESTLAEDRPPILVSQNFRNDDRYRYDGNEKYDKYVTEEFLPHVVYGCQVILTNPTSNTQKLSALLQIPRGAIPVSNSSYQGPPAPTQCLHDADYRILFLLPCHGYIPPLPRACCKRSSPHCAYQPDDLQGGRKAQQDRQNFLGVDCAEWQHERASEIP